MKLVMWLAAIGALLWSALGWLAWTIAGKGEAAIVTLSRWLQIDPASTQWIAEAFALAGGIAQWLILLVWLMGMGIVGILTWLGSQAAIAARDLEMKTSPYLNSRDNGIIDGEIEGRNIERK